MYFSVALQSIFPMVGVVIVDLVDHLVFAQLLDIATICIGEIGGPFLDGIPLFPGRLSSVEHNGVTHESVRYPCHLFAPYPRPLGRSRRLHISLRIDNSNRDLFAYNRRRHCIVPQSDPEIEGDPHSLALPDWSWRMRFSTCPADKATYAESRPSASGPNGRPGRTLFSEHANSTVNHQ
jgi:hypothetical protein